MSFHKVMITTSTKRNPTNNSKFNAQAFHQETYHDLDQSSATGQ